MPIREELAGALRGTGGESRTYGDLVSRSSTQRAGAVTVRVIGLDDLIRAKEFAASQKVGSGSFPGGWFADGGDQLLEAGVGLLVDLDTLE